MAVVYGRDVRRGWSSGGGLVLDVLVPASSQPSVQDVKTFEDVSDSVIF